MIVSLALAGLSSTSLLGAHASHADSPASIVYALDHGDGYSEIHLMRENGNHFARLTHYKGIDISPTWSPDGESIAFIRDSDSRPPEVYGGDIVEDFNENFDLYLMNADGSGLTRLTRGPAEESAPEWSPDGTKIAFVSTGYDQDQPGDHDIVVLDLESGEKTNVTDDEGDDYSPSWSPDGSTIAFSSTYRPCTKPCDESQADVYTVPGDGGDPTLLTGPAFEDVDPVWSPDGTRIFFGRAGRQFDIWSMDADGSNRTRHTRTGDADEGNFSFSSDPSQAQRFVFGRRPGGRSSLWMMDLEAGTETRLSARGQRAFTADWR